MFPLLEVLLLGIVQGLTEFLPVSSSGHLAVGQILLGIEQNNLMLSVTLHAGTLLATLIFFRRRLQLIIGDLMSNLTSPGKLLEQEAGRDALVVALASIPTAIIGLAFKDAVEAFTTQAAVVASCFLLTAVLLWSIRQAPSGDRLSVSVWGALLVGLFQGLAVMPGISRSGATIAVLLWLGVRSERAFELSMLVSLPAILGAFLLETKDAFDHGQLPLSALAGAVVSLVVGYVALHLLRGLVTTGRLFWFSLYLVPLAAATFLFA